MMPLNAKRRNLLFHCNEKGSENIFCIFDIKGSAKFRFLAGYVIPLPGQGASSRNLGNELLSNPVM